MVIQYCRVRVRTSDDDAWRMPVSDSNACSGVRSLGMVGRACSAIVPAGASRAEESGKICGGAKDPSSLAPEYQGDNL